MTDFVWVISEPSARAGGIEPQMNLAGMGEGQCIQGLKPFQKETEGQGELTQKGLDQ